MKQCTAALGSLTYAIKAQRALAENGLACEIVKLDSSMTRRGCAYGVTFSCEEQRAVRSILGKEKITVTGFVNGGGELL